MKFNTLIIILISMNMTLFAQTEDWIVKSLYDDQITVQYRFSEQVDEEGQPKMLIEDLTTTTVQADLESCINLMKDVEQHKEFTGDKISKIVKSVSDHEWIVYYYSNNPWPIKDSDNVSRLTMATDTSMTTVTFTLTAVPDEYEDKGVNRMEFYQAVYTFKDLGNDQVSIVIAGRSIPPVNVPDWLVKSAFPGTPAKSVKKMVTLLKQSGI